MALNRPVSAVRAVALPRAVTVAPLPTVASVSLEITLTPTAPPTPAAPPAANAPSNWMYRSKSHADACTFPVANTVAPAVTCAIVVSLSE